MARELMLTGRIIDADEAFRIHLVHEVTAPEDHRQLGGGRDGAPGEAGAGLE